MVFAISNPESAQRTPEPSLNSFFWGGIAYVCSGCRSPPNSKAALSPSQRHVDLAA